VVSLVSPKNGHSASGSQQYHCKDCGAHKVLDPEPQGYSEEEKDWVYRAYRERGSKRAISRIFGVSRCCIDPLSRKKGREAGSVADGFRPAEENDILELDERKDLRLKTIEQAVALGGPVP
jgi:hypothetical protein